MTCASTNANSIARFKTLEQDCNVLHHFKYTYNDAIFTRMLDKFLITCPEHGNFAMTPAHHLRGEGCPLCSRRGAAETRRSSTLKFVQKAIAKQPTYDYSQVIYLSSSTKVLVGCPIHGSFSITPNKLLQGRGCPQCKGATISQKLTKPFSIFIQEAHKVHSSNYEYDEASYINAKTPMQILCKSHGYFSQTPDLHINKACGCPVCGIATRSKSLALGADRFIQKASKVHNNYYSYEHVVYTNNNTSVIITCPEHGNYLQLPSNHLQGKGCSLCYNGLYANVPTFLYYIQITAPSGQVLYKVGITSHSVQQRFATELNLGYTINVLSLYRFLEGRTAFYYEQRFLSTYRAYKYSSCTSFLHRGSGDSELFTTNVLSL